MKNERIKRTAFLMVLLILAGFILVRSHQATQRRQVEQKLQAILSTVTFHIDNNGDELQALTAFRPSVDQLGPRSAAAYYGTLTKLYMLRADADNAFITFVDAQIQGEISRAYDIIAWLYADIAQIYVSFHTYDLATACYETALRYGESAGMSSVFYENCYTMLADLCARQGDPAQARAYYLLAEENDTEDLPEYQSMDLRRRLILADITRQEGDYTACESSLAFVGQTIDALDYPPMDFLWASGIYYPYMELCARLALERGDLEQALVYMDGMFAAGTLYGQVDSLMNFLTEAVAVLKDIDTASLAPELAAVVESYTQRLLLEFPQAFQSKNAMAGAHIYNSNLATIQVFVQKYKVENFYLLVAQCAVIVVCVIAALILFWRRSVERARIDGLTGAYTRKHFNRVLEKLKNGTAPYGVIMYDIDHFKQINDGYGHEAGDAVLRDISARVLTLLDRGCKLYRYGGDEFCIICLHKPLAEMGALAETIRACAESMCWSGGFRATLSMGAADSLDGGDVMAKVDEKMYASKEAGRNHVSW